MADGAGWLDDLPETVRRQRDLLRRLLAMVERHEEYRWLELSASLARGAGDEFSDVDVGVGVSDPDWPAAVDRTERRLAELAPVTDRFRQAMSGTGSGTGRDKNADAAWHLVTLYGWPDPLGVQLSLVVMPASWRPGLPPGAVALYDADGRLRQRWEPSVFRGDARTADEWAGLAWVALGDLAKYLDRDSRWEAHTSLQTARGHVWQLVAHRQGLDYPAFGLTSVLDADVPSLPEGIEGTVAGLDPAGLRTAGLALVEVLERLRGELPPIGEWARHRLRSAGT